MATVVTKFGSVRQEIGANSPSDTSSDNVATYSESKVPITKVNSSDSIPPLGEKETTKKFWFQKSVKSDPNAIATQVRYMLSDRT
jgi:hypothetical protein